MSPLTKDLAAQGTYIKEKEAHQTEALLEGERRAWRLG